MKKISIVAAICFVAATSFAGVCKMTIDRKACPGKEKEAYKPYKDQNPTIEDKPAKSLAECQTKAEGESKVKRKGTLSEKTVKATFDGADAGTYNDKPGC